MSPEEPDVVGEDDGRAVGAHPAFTFYRADGSEISSVPGEQAPVKSKA
jgi:hypothetical protein